MLRPYRLCWLAPLVLCCASFSFGGVNAYVVNSASPSLTVVDMGSATVLPSVRGQIDAGNQPSELYILPDNRTMLLTEYGGNTLRKIDLRMGTLGASVGAAVLGGSGPASLVVSRDNRFAWVGNEITNDVSVVDIASMTEVARIAVETTPVQVNQRPDGAFIYVLNQDSNSVTVIDSQTRTVVNTVPVGMRPNQFAVHPSGQRAFIPNLNSDTISVFDLSTNSVVGSAIPAAGGPGIIVFSPTGSRMYVLKQTSGTVQIFDLTNLANPTSLGSFTVGAVPTDMAVTSDGLYAYVACKGSNQVFVVGFPSHPGGVIESDPIDMGAGTQPFTVAFDGDENNVFVTLAGTNQLAAISTNTDQVVVRLPTGTAPAAFVQLNQPYVYPGGILNAASFAIGQPAAGGAIIALFGEGLAITEAVAQTQPLPPSLGGTTVKFSGNPAPLFYVSGLQINAQVPSAMFGQSSATLEVIGPNGSDLSTIPLNPAASPGLFTIPSRGTGPGAIQHAADYSLVDADHPAAPGEIILIYATGLGQTNPPVQDGQGLTGAAPLVGGNPMVQFDSQQVTPLYAGQTPFNAGLYQINATVPASLTTGTHKVSVTVNGITSNAVDLPVR